jgi:amidase
MRALHGVPGALSVLLLLACGSDDGGGGSGPSGGAGGTAGAAGSGGSAGATENPADYLDRPLTEQVSAIESGKITSAGLTAAYLDRIATRDADIHAVLLLDPDAANKAAALDAASGSGKKLSGAPILVKDNIDTQGLATTAGSLALQNNVPASDAFVVARLHAENGLMLGKTNLSEWANFRGYNATSGWSSLGAQTFNGANPDYNPCGSSSGSGAAVAAGMCSAALGTETDGSIVCPAAMNGVVGFKPTVGLVSRSGVIPISHSQDTVGPITKNVRDAARLLSVLAGPDPADPATEGIPASLSLDFETPLDGATLAGKRLGVVGVNADPAVQDVFDAARDKLAQAGAVLVNVNLDQFSFGSNELTVLLHEFKVGLNQYLAAHPQPGQPTTLAELISFNQTNAATVMPHFGQELFTSAEATTGLDAPEYLSAKQAALAATQTNGIDALLAAENLDALVAATGDTAWITDYSGDPQISLVSGPAAVAGYPHLTVPMGEVGGLPVGLSFFGGAWTDAEILALGYAFEQLP